MAVPKDVLRLVERFREHRDAYLSAEYNEATLRREFLEPLFQAMGWDVDNTKNYAEAYKPVVHEETLRTLRTTEAPDYTFRLGGVRKFFVEAKKPSIDVKGDAHPSYQLRRYGWSAKLPLSILTDFEEFAVYDCTKKPSPTDTAATARILYLTYEDYAERWEEIAGLFSPEAIQKGAFDQFAASAKGKKGTAAVDDAFLDDIEAWRDLLAHNLALRNPELSQRELNDAVQTTIDRIIFLRICGDRGIENYGALRGLLNGTRVYPRLVELFRTADDRYNSGLFHFRAEKDRPGAPDTLTLSLEIDDKTLKEILCSLYYPVSPYEFSVLPADLLGHVYEQFLGKVIRLTAGHRAVVEDKPEVKKAGGVYYTPTYIVDYIVKNTVGKLLEEKTPKEAETLRVLDPACGSGSFLLGAYQHLLDWHESWYAENGPERWARGRSPKLYHGPKGDWRLTTAEKKRILLDHLFGVDIDPQAVEVTKLSLLLKVLEDENAETLGKTLRLLHERALPDLGRNVQCGNSLIGTGFYDDHPLETLSEEERYRINAFDWETAFPEIMKKGGFDAVIGNPPYGATLTPRELAYLRVRFGGEAHSLDSYELFLIQASRLLSRGGRLSMIIPAAWLTGEKTTPSRSVLIKSLTPVAAYTLPFDVFGRTYIDTAVIALARAPATASCLIHVFPKKVHLTAIPDAVGTPVPVSAIRADESYRLTPLLSVELAPILCKLRGQPLRFGSLFEIQRGVQPYSRGKHSEEEIAARFLHADRKVNDEYLPELQGTELSRYAIAPGRTSYLHYCPQIASIRSIHMFQGRRIVLRRLLTRRFRLQASSTDDTLITTDNVLNVVPRLPGVDVSTALGILNSRLLSWYYVSSSMIAQKDDFPQVTISGLAALPFPEVGDPHTPRLTGLVEQMLALHKQLGAAKTDHEKSLLQRQIDATDHKIDELVYELYGLTTKEIQIVEEATG